MTVPFLLEYDEPSETVKIVFAGTIHLQFQLSDASTDQVLKFKGLLHCRPIRDRTEALVLDKEQILTLVYQDGCFHMHIEKEQTHMRLPITKEAHSHLDRLLDLFM